MSVFSTTTGPEERVTCYERESGKLLWSHSDTERYANMVKRMSDKTQFVFISHNKIAMEMAEQLIGVTMQEQGVSRIVAVDMESAVHLAEVE